ncbi:MULTISPECIES: NAD(P)/FAD-dependent oxidoreductase [Amycolatopsis]|uniref:Oxidoreductase n=2 Tax=Amycolatopsis TaxID=1813 RepID=A0A558A7V0_9PSEU|nr:MULTISPECIES: FAD-dependent oxidoreductase [Amycolatopsis]PKV92522.1 phthalate 3,4-dioxygenase ferredoxin reductase subunit [Amycolatopsis niigatensis]TVT20330.1 oxidoreductase [Amycolatopsis acidiphila]GHG81522.1 ferredoxin reductase [Amycolatopsis acidiphila]
MSAHAATEPGRLVIVGASLAGVRAARAARHAGHTGTIILIGAEEHLPYDRPPLSKTFLTHSSDHPAAHEPDEQAHPPAPAVLMAEDELRDDLGVDLRLGVTATGLDTDSRELLLHDQQRLPYDRLIIATGATARRWPTTTHLAGLHYLRTLDDARALRAALARTTNLVIIGAGFIGSEVAATATQHGIHATIVETQDTPLAHAVGQTAGTALARLHTQAGTTLKCGVQVTDFSGTGHIEQVHLSDGSVLPADTVLVGIGAVPTTGWLTDSGVALDDGVACDPYLATSAPGVYAAGDLARFPHPRREGTLRLEHWTAAAEQGAHAARNAITTAAPTRYEPVPYVWSDWYSHRIQIIGDPHTDQPSTLIGDPDTGQFTVLYRHNNHITAALAVNQPRAIAKLRRLITQKAPWADALTQTTTLNPPATPPAGSRTESRAT